MKDHKDAKHGGYKAAVAKIGKRPAMAAMAKSAPKPKKK